MTAKLFTERTVAVVVAPKGDHLFSEMSTRIEIVDEAAGEFLQVSQKTGRPDGERMILVDPDEWPALRQAIDKMIGECRSEEK